MSTLPRRFRKNFKSLQNFRRVSPRNLAEKTLGEKSDFNFSPLNGVQINKHLSRI